jgi:hypothetical protein
MSRIAGLTFPIIVTLLAAGAALPWEETRHPIGEVLVQRLLLDERYVLCGTDAYWGTNTFGLFVFDRVTEAWTNYPLVEDELSASSAVKSIKKVGNHADVMFRRGLIRFDLNTGEAQADPEVRRERGPTVHTLETYGRKYTFSQNSVTVSDGTGERTYLPATPPPDPVTGKPLEHYAFCAPVLYGDRIFFGYNHGRWTVGLGSIGLEDTTFHFYPSDIFKGTATGGFVLWSSIIFTTAEYRYECNAGPAAGLVQFAPGESTFAIWQELPLPDYPLAIFCLEQDSLEYWLGTDRGVLRIDKMTNVVTQYGVRKGIAKRDGINIHACFGDLWKSRNQYPASAELNKGDSVELLEVYHGWCKIKAPEETRGFVSASDVSEVQSGEGPRTLKVMPDAVVRVRSSPDANALTKFDRFGNPPEEEYHAMGWVGPADSAEWYIITLPTAWVHKNDLIFSMGEVE